MEMTITRSVAVGFGRDNSKNVEAIVNLGIRWIARVEPHSVLLSVDVYISINKCVSLDVTRLMVDDQQLAVAIGVVDHAQQEH